jgi:hypothetical protein
MINTSRYRVEQASIKVFDTTRGITREYSVEQWNAGKRLFEIFGDDVLNGIARYLRYQFDMDLIEAKILADALHETLSNDD